MQVDREEEEAVVYWVQTQCDLAVGGVGYTDALWVMLKGEKLIYIKHKKEPSGKLQLVWIIQNKCKRITRDVDK